MLFLSRMLFNKENYGFTPPRFYNFVNNLVLYLLYCTAYAIVLSTVLFTIEKVNTTTVNSNQTF